MTRFEVFAIKLTLPQTLVYTKRVTCCLISSIAMNETEQERMTELCTAIAAEQNSTRMIALVEELNRLLETKQEHLNRKARQQARLKAAAGDTTKWHGDRIRLKCEEIHEGRGDPHVSSRRTWGLEGAIRTVPE